MEATCNHCDHWHQEAVKAQVPSSEFGVCDELSGLQTINPEYVLPVVAETSKVETGFEMVTGAMFGCNHFSERKGWI